MLTYAAEEASGMGHKHIGSEHLVLGLLREEASLAAEILREGGLREEAVREQVRHSASLDPTRSGEELLAQNIARGQTMGRTLSTRIDMTPEAMRATMYAQEEAEKLGQARIDTEHLLLGLLREERSAAGKLLQKSGFRVDELREHIQRGEQTEE